MCGIAGGINSPVFGKDQERMLQKMGHRGPDDRGLFNHENIWLGNVRLSVQDLSHRGHQPMQTADGRYTLVYNGELYNQQQLRKDLGQKGFHFQSDADTETLLYAFACYGKDCLQKLDGIFAFAVYDRQRNSLFMARDPLGVKPFYYYADGDVLLFSSELKTLTGISSLDYSINTSSLAAYVQLLYQPGTATPFQKINKLLPGHFLHYENGKLSAPESYYSIPFTGTYNHGLSTQDWIKLTEKTLVKAVRSQLVSDAPVGFFLSGGLDSSLVAAIAKQEDPGRQLHCFTIDTGNDFKNEGFEDDLPFARMVASQLGAQLTEVSGTINMEAEFDNMIWHLDEPQADPAALHTAHIARAAQQQGIKVLLSGAGADDVFSGYRRHQALYYERLLACYPTLLQQPALKALKLIGKEHTARRLSKLFAAGSGNERHRIQQFQWLTNDRVTALFKEPRNIVLPDQYFKQLLQEIPSEKSALNQLLYLEMRTFLPDHNLNYTDKMSMAASVETRVPFLSTDLIALSAAMPPALKMRGRQTKFILREVAKNYLPPEIIYRKKTGFGAPVRQWIKGEMKPFIQERLLSGQLEKWDIFNQQAVETLIRENEAGKIDASYSIFALLAVASWLRQFTAP